MDKLYIVQAHQHNRNYYIDYIQEWLDLDWNNLLVHIDFQRLTDNIVDISNNFLCYHGLDNFLLILPLYNFQCLSRDNNHFDIKHIYFQNSLYRKQYQVIYKYLNLDNIDFGSLYISLFRLKQYMNLFFDRFLNYQA